MSKQVTIHVTRKLTLNRAGHEPVVLQPGRNVVDAEVAEHPFVKHHTTDAIDATPDEVNALRARVAELEAEVAELKAAEGGKKHKKADTKAD